MEVNRKHHVYRNTVLNNQSWSLPPFLGIGTFIRDLLVRLRRAGLDGKVDILLTGRLAEVTVFQKSMARPARGMYGKRAFRDSRRNEMGVKLLKTHDAAKYPISRP
jgi:hypothetical protein